MTMLGIRRAGFSLAVLAGLSACSGHVSPETGAAAPAPAAAEAAEAAANTPTAATDTSVSAVATPAPDPEVVAAIEAAEVAAVSMPDTADGLWQAIDRHSAELGDVVASGNLATVHPLAYTIRNLVAALPAHTPKLSVDEATKQKNDVQFVSALADRLDAAGDSADRAGAQDSYEKLVAVLNGMTRYK